MGVSVYGCTCDGADEMWVLVGLQTTVGAEIVQHTVLIEENEGVRVGLH